MAQPFDVRTRRGTLKPGSVVRQYRPITDPSLPQTVQDAFRQLPDQIYSLRQQFGPNGIYVQGQGDPITVTTKPLGAGVTLKLTRPGIWIITASVALAIIGDPGQIFTLSLVVGGDRQGLTGQWNSPGDTAVMMHQQWQITSITGKETIVALIVKDGGGGTSAIDPSNSTLSAVYAGTR